MFWIWIYLILLAPALLALVLAALVAWRRARGKGPAGPSSLRRWTVAGVLAAIGITLLGSFSLMFTEMFWEFASLSAQRRVVQLILYTAPLAGGLIAVVILMAPRELRDAPDTARPPVRQPRRVASPWWFIAFTVLVLGATMVAIAAGLAAVPDGDGRLTMYWLESGDYATGAMFYGWYFSVPCLILLAVLVAAVLLAARTIPELAQEDPKAPATRRWRIGTVIAVASGAVLVHLQEVLRYLAPAAGLHSRFPTQQGAVTLQGPFTELERPLQIAAFVAGAGGWFLWLIVLMMAAGAFQRQHGEGRSHAITVNAASPR